MRHLLFCGFTALLVGCSSGPYRLPEPDRISSAVASPTSAQTAKITVKRHKIFRGGALDGRFTVNGQEVVKLSRGEMYSFPIDPGKYEFGVRSYQPVMMVPVPMYYKYDLEAEAGKEYLFYLYATGGAGVAIDLVTNEAEWD